MNLREHIYEVVDSLGNHQLPKSKIIEVVQVGQVGLAAGTVRRFIDRMRREGLLTWSPIMVSDTGVQDWLGPK